MPQNGCSDLLYDLAIKFSTYLATSDEVAHISIATLLVRKQPWASLPCWIGVPLTKGGFQNPTPDQTISELCSSHNSSTTALVFDLRSEMQVHVPCKMADCCRSGSTVFTHQSVNTHLALEAAACDVSRNAVLMKKVVVQP